MLLRLAHRLTRMSYDEGKTTGRMKRASFPSLLEVTTDYGSEQGPAQLRFKQCGFCCTLQAAKLYGIISNNSIKML